MRLRTRPDNAQSFQAWSQPDWMSCHCTLQWCFQSFQAQWSCYASVFGLVQASHQQGPLFSAPNISKETRLEFISEIIENYQTNPSNEREFDIWAPSVDLSIHLSFFYNKWYTREIFCIFDVQYTMSKFQHRSKMFCIGSHRPAPLTTTSMLEDLNAW